MENKEKLKEDLMYFKQEAKAIFGEDFQPKLDKNDLKYYVQKAKKILNEEPTPNTLTVKARPRITRNSIIAQKFLGKK